MINFETYYEVRRLSRELNLSPSQIAAETGLNIKTIRKWLDKPRYEPRSKAPRRTSKLDPYKNLIISWLEKHPYTGMQIFQRLRAEHGYTGGRSILHDFIATVRPVRHQAFLKLAFEPGDCMQIDSRYSWSDAHRRLLAQAPLLRRAALLQPAALCGVFPEPKHGMLLGRQPPRAGILRRNHSARDAR